MPTKKGNRPVYTTVVLFVKRQELSEQQVLTTTLVFAPGTQLRMSGPDSEIAI